MHTNIHGYLRYSLLFLGVIYYMVQFSAQQVLLRTGIALTALIFSLLHRLHWDDPYKICINVLIAFISTLADIYRP